MCLRFSLCLLPANSLWLPTTHTRCDGRKTSPKFGISQLEFHGVLSVTRAIGNPVTLVELQITLETARNVDSPQKNNSTMLSMLNFLHVTRLNHRKYSHYAHLESEYISKRTDLFGDKMDSYSESCALGSKGYADSGARPHNHQPRQSCE